MRVVLVLLSIVVVACGGSTTEPARTDPVRVEAPPTETSTDEPAERAAPRRVEADPSGGAASTREVPRRDRPTVPPPPVEPPTSF